MAASEAFSELESDVEAVGQVAEIIGESVNVDITAGGTSEVFNTEQNVGDDAVCEDISVVEATIDGLGDTAASVVAAPEVNIPEAMQPDVLTNGQKNDFVETFGSTDRVDDGSVDVHSMDVDSIKGFTETCVGAEAGYELESEAAKLISHVEGEEDCAKQHVQEPYAPAAEDAKASNVLVDNFHGEQLASIPTVAAEERVAEVANVADGHEAEVVAASVVATSADEPTQTVLQHSCGFVEDQVETMGNSTSEENTVVGEAALDADEDVFVDPAPAMTVAEVPAQTLRDRLVFRFRDGWRSTLTGLLPAEKARYSEEHGKKKSSDAGSECVNKENSAADANNATNTCADLDSGLTLDVETDRMESAPKDEDETKSRISISEVALEAKEAPAVISNATALAAGTTLSADMAVAAPFDCEALVEPLAATRAMVDVPTQSLRERLAKRLWDGWEVVANAAAATADVSKMQCEGGALSDPKAADSALETPPDGSELQPTIAMGNGPNVRLAHADSESNAAESAGADAEGAATKATAAYYGEEIDVATTLADASVTALVAVDDKKAVGVTADTVALLKEPVLDVEMADPVADDAGFVEPVPVALAGEGLAAMSDAHEIGQNTALESDVLQAPVYIPSVPVLKEADATDEADGSMRALWMEAEECTSVSLTSLDLKNVASDLCASEKAEVEQFDTCNAEANEIERFETSGCSNADARPMLHDEASGEGVGSDEKVNIASADTSRLCQQSETATAVVLDASVAAREVAGDTGSLDETAPLAAEEALEPGAAARSAATVRSQSLRERLAKRLWDSWAPISAYGPRESVSRADAQTQGEVGADEDVFAEAEPIAKIDVQTLTTQAVDAPVLEVTESAVGTDACGSEQVLSIETVKCAKLSSSSMDSEDFNLGARTTEEPAAIGSEGCATDGLVADSADLALASVSAVAAVRLAGEGSAAEPVAAASILSQPLRTELLTRLWGGWRSALGGHGRSCSDEATVATLAADKADNADTLSTSMDAVGNNETEMGRPCETERHLSDDIASAGSAMGRADSFGVEGVDGPAALSKTNVTLNEAKTEAEDLMRVSTPTTAAVEFTLAERTIAALKQDAADATAVDSAAAATDTQVVASLAGVADHEEVIAASAALGDGLQTAPALATPLTKIHSQTPREGLVKRLWGGWRSTLVSLLPSRKGGPATPKRRVSISKATPKRRVSISSHCSISSHRRKTRSPRDCQKSCHGRADAEDIPSSETSAGAPQTPRLSASSSAPGTPQLTAGASTVGASPSARLDALEKARAAFDRLRTLGASPNGAAAALLTDIARAQRGRKRRRGWEEEYCDIVECKTGDVGLAELPTIKSVASCAEPTDQAVHVRDDSDEAVAEAGEVNLADYAPDDTAGSLASRNETVYSTSHGYNGSESSHRNIEMCSSEKCCAEEDLASCESTEARTLKHSTEHGAESAFGGDASGIKNATCVRSEDAGDIADSEAQAGTVNHEAVATADAAPAAAASGASEAPVAACLTRARLAAESTGAENGVVKSATKRRRVEAQVVPLASEPVRSRPVRMCQLRRPLEPWRNERVVYTRLPGSWMPTVESVVVYDAASDASAPRDARRGRKRRAKAPPAKASTGAAAKRLAPEKQLLADRVPERVPRKPRRQAPALAVATVAADAVVAAATSARATVDASLRKGTSVLTGGVRRCSNQAGLGEGCSRVDAMTSTPPKQRRRNAQEQARPPSLYELGFAGALVADSALMPAVADASKAAEGGVGVADSAWTEAASSLELPRPRAVPSKTRAAAAPATAAPRLDRVLRTVGAARAVGKAVRRDAPVREATAEVPAKLAQKKISAQTSANAARRKVSTADAPVLAPPARRVKGSACAAQAKATAPEAKRQRGAGRGRGAGGSCGAAVNAAQAADETLVAAKRAEEPSRSQPRASPPDTSATFATKSLIGAIEASMHMRSQARPFANRALQQADTHGLRGTAAPSAPKRR